MNPKSPFEERSAQWSAVELEALRRDSYGVVTKHLLTILVAWYVSVCVGHWVCACLLVTALCDNVNSQSKHLICPMFMVWFSMLDIQSGQEARDQILQDLREDNNSNQCRFLARPDDNRVVDRLLCNADCQSHIMSSHRKPDSIKAYC